MKNFLILHYGFVSPTPEVMEGWNAWFEMIKDREVERRHLPVGSSITNEGVMELPLSETSLTGFTIIKADNLQEAKHIAAHCPIILRTEVYEID